MKEKDENKEFNWGPGIFLIAYHAILIPLLPVYFWLSPPSWSLVLVTIALYFMTGLSITAGYHRYFSHRSFKAHPFVEFIMVVLGTLSGQGSVIRWSYDHRLHHAHVDTEQDPYSIQKGFWYAHCLWLFEKPREIDEKIIPDLIKKPLLRWQHHYYGTFFTLLNFASFLFFGWCFGDYIGAFMMTWWIRLFALHHSTWFINSLAHTWGDKPFCQEHSAVNNYVISLLTFGEGYHNYHHTFANDYRNGIKWYHFDPTKWLIKGLNFFGLTYDLKLVDPLTIKKKMILERRSLVMSKLQELWYVKREDLEVKLQDISESILVKIRRMNELKQKYRSLKKNYKEKGLLLEIKKELKLIKKSLQKEWRLWKRFSNLILKLKPLQPI
ncbi:MAG: fatty acid desaturase [Chlamydiales bacterium]